QRRRGTIPVAVGVGGGGAARPQSQSRRFAARVEPLDLGGDARHPRVERLNLLAIERDLLFLARDGDLARVRGLTRLGRPCFRLDQLDAQASEVGLDFADPPRRDRLALPRVGQARARRLDRLRELTVLAGEEHLLPATQFVAQTLVALGLAGLALQRAPL